MMMDHERRFSNFVGYDLGDNDEVYNLINEVDALVTKVVNLIYDVVEEVDVLLHGKKVNIFMAILLFKH